jgi:hypothetical protein
MIQKSRRQNSEAGRGKPETAPVAGRRNTSGICSGLQTRAQSLYLIEQSCLSVFQGYSLFHFDNDQHSGGIMQAFFMFFLL